MQVCIAKVVRTGRFGEAESYPIILAHSYHLLYGETNRVFRQGMAFEMLEPYALKGACSVLRGLGDGNIPRLPDRIDDLILQGWDCYSNKVANGFLTPENEKMMQLQLAQIFQTLSPIYEYRESESIKVLLEVPATLRNGVNRIIDIVIAHDENGETAFFSMELKCFRLYSRSSGKKRWAQNLGMYDYWEDIEGYFDLDNYKQGYQLTLTDDPYYVESSHNGPQNAPVTAYVGQINNNYPEIQDNV